MSNNHQHRMKKIAFCRPTWAEVDLDNLAHNFRVIRGRTGAGVKIMPMVKADAYGHGMVPCARKLAECGADYFGVASIEEGIELRKAGIGLPVLVLGAVLSDSAAGFFDAGLIPALCDWQTALALEEEARRRGRRIKVHIKVDTGMGRIGVLWDEAAVFIRKVSFLDHIEIEGLFTHFSCADEEGNELTGIQEERFFRAAETAAAAGIKIPFLHAANSAAILNRPHSGFNIVRPGLALYGVSPVESDAGGSLLKPVLSLKSRLVYTKRLPAGSGVSYGHTYRVPDECVVATIPLGYGDGYPRNLSNCGPVLIRGKRYKISGLVCMDQLMVDAGKTCLCAGEETVFIGQQGKEKITAGELARLGGTIAYEILCGIGSRVPRVYKTEASFIAPEDWKEKRVFTRFPARMRLDFSCNETGFHGEAETRDISASGLSFEFNRVNSRSGGKEEIALNKRSPFPAHSHLNLCLLDSRGAEVLQAGGDVVWSRKVSFQQYRAGISFSKLPGASFNDLRLFFKKYGNKRSIPVSGPSRMDR
ncbi:MAG: alanine racemase [Candidatus Omnitrophota bacterium]